MTRTPDYTATIQLLNQKLINLEKHRTNLQTQLAQIQSAKAFKIWQYLTLIKHGSLKLIHQPSKLPKAVSTLFSHGPTALTDKVNLAISTEDLLLKINEQYEVWFHKNYPTLRQLEDQRIKSKSFKHQPLISIITPTYNSSIIYLKECIESVLNQSYPKWEMCLADDCSTDEEVRKIVKEYALQDKRIKYTFRKRNGNISRASNSAMKLALGDWIGLLDHDDLLWPNALFEAVKLINDKPKTEFIYSDEDKLSEDGLTHCDPFFKPGWSPDLLLSFNYITHFAILKSDLMKKIGGFRPGFEGAQDYDLFLRATEQTKHISNIQTVIYSWRKIKNSTASDYTVKPQANISAVMALEDALKRRNIVAKVLPGQCVGTFRVKYKIHGKPLVSIIIPTKNHLDLLKRCIQSIIEKSTYSNYEIIIVDTGSTNSEVTPYYKELLDKHSNIQLLYWNKPFNYSAVNNYGVTKSKGEYLLFLNNDTEVLIPDWIESLLEHAQRSEVGAVGAKLLYPNSRIQHAGIEFLSNLWPHHYEINIPDDSHSLFPYPNYKDLIKNPDSVTGACLMIDASKFKKVGAFNNQLRYEFQDVDLCVRLYQMGYLTTYTPFSKLVHFESQTFSTENKSLSSVAIRFYEFISNKNIVGKFNPQISNVFDEVKQIVNQIKAYK